jgi:hypothetical protein
MMEAQMNKMGQDGWRLVAVTQFNTIWERVRRPKIVNELRMPGDPKPAGRPIADRPQA